jgi:DeoR family fructose operon transcriptional repressor
VWFHNRHQKIISILENRKRATTDSLIEEFGVSDETIRRDLMALETKGLLKRVHGGAILLSDSSTEEPFQKRMALQQSEKLSIAKAAARYIQPGQSVFIDSGTTTSAFAAELAKIPNIFVITNSFDIVTVLRSSDEEHDVLLLGGKVISDVPGTYGELTLSEITRFHVDIAVLSPVALHPEHGASSSAIHEAEVAKAMIRNSQMLIMLADHTKLGSTSQVQYCTCPQIDLLITHKKSNDEDIALLTDAGVKEIFKVC